MRRNGTGLINPDLLDEIDEQRQDLETGGLEACLEHCYRSIRTLAARQASELDEDNLQRGNVVLERFKDAMEYARRTYSGDAGNLFSFIQDVAARIEPEQAGPEGHAPLRKGTTSIPGIEYHPPVDEPRIRRDLERVRKFALEAPLHPLEESTFLYFHIARIQPFENGNKRTAAVTMNAVNDYHRYPAVAVGPRDRYTFSGLFSGAIHGFRRDMSEGAQEITCRTIGPEQRALFEFFANKTLDTLEHIELGLRGLDRYTVSLDTKYPGVEFNAKRKLNAYLDHNSPDRPHQVRLDRKHHELDIVGNISPEKLAFVLEQVNHLKYRIHDARDYDGP